MKGKNKNRTIYKYNLYILGSRLSFSLAFYDKRFIILILLGDNLKQEFVSGRLLHYSRRRLDWNTTRITGEKKCCVKIQYLRYKIIIILLRPDACMTTAARTITVLHGLWISMIKASVNLKQNNKNQDDPWHVTKQQFMTENGRVEERPTFEKAQVNIMRSCNIISSLVKSHFVYNAARRRQIGWG